MKRFLWVGLVLCLVAVWAGCGDTFRPIIIPNPPAFPDPRAAHTIISINDNGNVNQGSAMEIDVSGDSILDVGTIGVAPVHAVQQTATQVLAVNQVDNSLTKLTFVGGLFNPTTISLPSGAAPNFVAVAPNDANAYVSMPATNPPSVAVINTTSNFVKATIPLPPASGPVALAVTPDHSKLYVANQGSGTLSSFNTVDFTARTINGSLSSPPIWLSPRSDNQRVYVLESNGTLAFLDTTGTSDTLTETTISTPGAAYMVYDRLSNRVYIPFTAQLAAVDVSAGTPVLLGTPTPIPTVATSSRGAQDPCATTSPTALTAVAVAALPDESRVYVGAFYSDSAGNLCPQVTAINTSNNSVKTSAAVPGFPSFAPYSPPACSTTRFRFTMAAAGDSSRVYLASCDGGNVNLIRTSDDTFLVSLTGPPSARAPIPPSNQPPPQNPVFLLAGP